MKTISESLYVLFAVVLWASVSVELFACTDEGKELDKAYELYELEKERPALREFYNKVYKPYELILLGFRSHDASKIAELKQLVNEKLDEVAAKIQRSGTMWDSRNESALRSRLRDLAGKCIEKA
jgi:hypothetical protein